MNERHYFYESGSAALATTMSGLVARCYTFAVRRYP